MKIQATITIRIGNVDFTDSETKQRIENRIQKLNDFLQRHEKDIECVVCGAYVSLDISKAIIEDERND